MSADPYPPAASTSYILVVNVVGVLLCLVVVLIGRMRRSSRADETRCYTPGPYRPVGEEGGSIKGGGEPKGSGVKPSPKAKATSSAKTTSALASPAADSIAMKDIKSAITHTLEGNA